MSQDFLFLVINKKENWEGGKDENLEVSEKGLHIKPGYRHGSYVIRMDSTLKSCRWHKLVLDADIPENTRVEVSYITTDDDAPLAELPKGWSEPLLNPKDALINGEGRYIWLRVALFGNGKTSPVVRSVKVYFPRKSYLRYLPAVYQEDQASRDFLERFLSLFETILMNLESSIEDIPRFFDPKSTPSEFLSWLSTWLGAIRDENWEEEKWREFLSKAVEFYKKRGTREGISELIKLYTGKYPIIVERFQLHCADEEFVEVLDKLFGCSYSFCVLLKPNQVRSRRELNVVRRIVEAEKPAHTHGGVVQLRQFIRLDGHTYIGMNSVLCRPRCAITDKAILSVDAFLDKNFNKIFS